MGVKDYDLNPDNNTQINGINIAEGCPPSGINNAIRQLMADVKAMASTPATSTSLGPVKIGSGIIRAPDGTISIDPWNIFPMRVPIAVDGVTFGGSDGRRAIMPGETEPRENWVLCDGGEDGHGGTVPDLRGRMILGASDEHTAGSTGGSETHSHSLSGTVGQTTLSVMQCPRHRHTYPYYIGSGVNTGSGSVLNAIDPGGLGVANSSEVGGSQAHTHTLDGTSGDASSLPSYYALALIMRCA